MTSFLWCCSSSSDVSVNCHEQLLRRLLQSVFEIALIVKYAEGNLWISATWEADGPRKESRNASSVSLISEKRWGRKCEVTKFICLATRVTFSDQVLIVYTEILHWQFSLRRMAWRLWKGTNTQLLCNCWSRRCQVRQATFADQSSFNCMYSVTATFETIYGLHRYEYIWITRLNNISFIWSIPSTTEQQVITGFIRRCMQYWLKNH